HVVIEAAVQRAELTQVEFVVRRDRPDRSRRHQLLELPDGRRWNMHFRLRALLLRHLLQGVGQMVARPEPDWKPRVYSDAHRQAAAPRVYNVGEHREQPVAQPVRYRDPAWERILRTDPVHMLRFD